MIKIISKQTRKYFSIKAKKQCRNKYGQFAKPNNCELGTCGKTCISSKCGVKEESSLKHSIKKWWFLFRWFLIGKYFCEMPKGLKQKKRLWYWMNKLLWITITFTSAYGIKCLMELI